MSQRTYQFIIYDASTFQSRYEDKLDDQKLREKHHKKRDPLKVITTNNVISKPIKNGKKIESNYEGMEAPRWSLPLKNFFARIVWQYELSMKENVFDRPYPNWERYWQSGPELKFMMNEVQQRNELIKLPRVSWDEGSGCVKYDELGCEKSLKAILNIKKNKVLEKLDLKKFFTPNSTYFGYIEGFIELRSSLPEEFPRT
ncbi:unnamed protein product [Wickerhamomyces anomalus]